MKAMHLKAADFTPQPWRNGGGSTTQLAVHGDGDSWTWRLSLAEVARSGPFSDFSGYDRIIMLVAGTGMELAIDGHAAVRLHDAFRPFSFDGGARTECRLLDGPVRDLNLMVDRRRARASLGVIDPASCGILQLDARWTLVYALRGTARASVPGLGATLATGELLRIDDAHGAELGLAALEPASRMAIVHIHPIDRPHR